MYTQRDVLTASPALDNSVALTHLQPGRTSSHSLCLNHWTFFRLPTAAPTLLQHWQDADLDVSSTISAALGSEDSTPRGLVLTLDTSYDAEAERFTSVDAFLHLSPTLPNDYYRVHTFDFPTSVFPAGTSRVDLFGRDSFTYADDLPTSSD